ncbi:MAG: hypothetical protein FPO08_04580 [Geobacter sp.]|nr:MAG: hypothetical protein FPO08_04580 [Geobacter sp.]
MATNKATEIKIALLRAGVPAALLPTNLNKTMPALTVNNDITTWGLIEIIGNGNVNFRPGPTYGAAFTATGGKGLANGSVSYAIYP